MEPLFKQGTLMLKAIANETRVRILHMLSCDEMCACDLGKCFNLTQPTLSHHLKMLVAADLIWSRREGRWAYYGLNWLTVRFLVGFLDHVLVPGEECTCKEFDHRLDTTEGCD